jgi:hypothetical protein
MKSILSEELNKFNLLTKYDSKLTLTENTEILNEGIGIKGFLELLVSNRELVKQALKDIKLKTFTTESGKVLKNTDEIIEAIKRGELTGKEIGGIRKSLYNATTSPSTLKDAIALDVARWIKKKHGELHTDADIIKLLTEKGFTDTNRILVKYKGIIGKPWKIIIDSFNADKDIQMLYSLKPNSKAAVENWIKKNVKTGTSVDKSEVVSFIKDFGEKGTKMSRFVKKYITPYVGEITVSKVLWALGLGLALGVYTFKDALVLACKRLGFDWSNKICADKEKIEKASW